MLGEIVEGKDLVSGKHYSTGEQLFGLGTLGAGSLLGKIYKGIKAGMSPEVEEAAGKLSNGTVFAMNGAGGASEIEKLAKNITKKIVGKGKEAYQEASKALLPREGDVGTYEDLIDAGSRGDNITPHHMPSAKYMEPNAGVPKNDGVAMNMEQPFPGQGGRHRLTDTYGMTGEKLQNYLNLSPRNALAHDIRDARSIYQNDNLYTPDIRQGLEDVIKMNKKLYPDLYKK
ncbi:type VII secretion protein [Clostridium kluyveri]|nr:type VII secretion protein [Clostridium kluyveri]